ncbi:MAG: fumarate hydratase [Candidatus Methanoliparum thermophilum]|uniref:Fumarate hydratase n=1 Tax=Methanoliparum thermophilum TaxID=2491083 RepID=A0A520KS16_METT2|nr:FumA C-terminus/TtdB family hydratase beta subunit [Candidatus Methanoliparum sp. LAM-1]RZN64580.1 MAG: fumarate hydratase [Candidatus Methanoliparum thermophilum]BDC35816.1 fumarate hydratase [Candidatus Methanoliparum sp. LAM-1]
MIKRLTTPLDVRDLKVGDIVSITGTIYTARDETHLRLLEESSPVNLEGAVIFHCGPIVRRTDEGWEVVAAGPTTSSRMNSLEPEIIKRFKIRGIIGKGGMDEETLNAMEKYGCVYLAMTGGAALLAVKSIERVEAVYWLDLGMPEAMWVFNVRDFGPMVVAMDTKGRNIYADVDRLVQERLLKIERELNLA